MPTKIFHISSAIIPSHHTHSYQICKMCEAFADNGLAVELIANNKNGKSDDIYAIYGCKKNFQFRALPFYDWMEYFGIEKFFRLRLFVLLCYVFFRFLFASRKGKIVFTRDHWLAFFVKNIGYTTIFEAHHPHNSYLYYKILKKVDLIATNSKGTAREFIRREFKRVIPAENGVDFEEFDISIDPVQVRSELGLPLNKKIICYVGSLYLWKGIDVLVGLSKIIDSGKWLVLIVGGSIQEIKEVKVSNNIMSDAGIRFIPRIEHSSVPKILKACDFLVMPDSGQEKRTMEYTSPVKIFEYFASKKPVLVSDIPSLRNIATDREVIFFKQGSAVDLKQKLDFACQLDNSKITDRAYILAKENTWKKRASKILDCL